jgi:membrane associated rhomboid family serine protease
MIVLFENLTRKQADLCTLVLTSTGIPHKVQRDRLGWSIWVDEGRYDRALAVMQEYFHENRQLPVVPDPPLASLTAAAVSGVAAALFLLICHAWIAGLDNVGEVVQRYGASASDIMKGETYRSITALMLHADSVHLAGNMAGIAFFGMAVCTVTGRGAGWLMILISGALGNMVNAFMYASGHLSIGASTSVFGAIGILSGYQFLKKRRTRAGRFSAWVPLGGGVALLGILGSAAHVDLTAHLFGLMTGMVMGMAHAFYIPVRLPASRQVLAGAAVFALILIAWSSGRG